MTKEFCAFTIDRQNRAKQGRMVPTTLHLIVALDQSDPDAYQG